MIPHTYWTFQAMAALQACQVIGMPECRINLAHVVTYLSEAPKSTRAFEGYNRARELAQQDMTLPVPMPMRNAPTGMMKELGYGEGYMYQPQFSYGHSLSGDFIACLLVFDVMIPLGIRSRTCICRPSSVGRRSSARTAT